MLFSFWKKFFFSPFIFSFSQQPGGGDSGGGGNGTYFVIYIPTFKYQPFDGNGEHRILLVKQNGFYCKCRLPLDIDNAPLAISEVLDNKISPEEIYQKLQKSLKESERKFLISGNSKYINSICQVLSNMFCKKQIEFSNEPYR